MKKSNISKIFSLILIFALMTSLSACRMNLPDTSGIGPDAAKDSSAEKTEEAAGEEKSEEDEEDTSDVEVELEDEVENEDVTAGTIEDGSYSAAALLRGETYFYVDAVEAVLKDKDAAKAADAKDKDGDLNKARLAYLTAYYEGDEASAKEDLDEYEKTEVTAGQKKAIQSFYPEIGKVFAQFDIKNYDFSAPTDSDETYVTYDVFSSANEPFSLEFSFEGDTVTDINLSYDGDLT